jgi:putative sugar O-methyltransferase
MSISSATQVSDDPALLEQMLREMKFAEELYRPTNYWMHYLEAFLPELRASGLANFRRRKKTILASFGATDVLLNPDNFPMQEATNWLFEYVKRKFDEASIDIFKCPTTKYGNPEDLVTINATSWSMNHLQSCLMFIDTVKHIRFETDMVFCELGPGLGRNVEILARLYEKATFLLFDIPPQLYVSNQYLFAVFGDRVVRYQDAVMMLIGSERETDRFKGKIVILPTWLMPVWTDVKVDVFWNSASFQEMEPNVVQNYLELVKKMNPEFIYINALPQGNYWGEWKEGMGGTKAPVLDAYYLNSLQEQYRIVATYYTDYLLREKRYLSRIFQRKECLPKA